MLNKTAYEVSVSKLEVDRRGNSKAEHSVPGGGGGEIGMESIDGEAGARLGDARSGERPAAKVSCAGGPFAGTV